MLCATIVLQMLCVLEDLKFNHTLAIGFLLMLQIPYMLVLIKMPACKLVYYLFSYRGGNYESCAEGYTGILCSECIGFN